MKPLLPLNRSHPQIWCCEDQTVQCICTHLMHIEDRQSDFLTVAKSRTRKIPVKLISTFSWLPTYIMQKFFPGSPNTKMKNVKSLPLLSLFALWLLPTVWFLNTPCACMPFQQHMVWVFRMTVLSPRLSCWLVSGQLEKSSLGSVKFIRRWEHGRLSRDSQVTWPETDEWGRSHTYEISGDRQLVNNVGSSPTS